MIVTGKIIDTDNGAAVPGATVELWTGNVMLKRGAAGGDGSFSLSVSSTPDKVKVSSASYITKDFFVFDVTKPLTFPMQKNIVEGEPVVVTATVAKPTKTFYIIAALLVALVLSQKK